MMGISLNGWPLHAKCSCICPYAAVACLSRVPQQRQKVSSSSVSPHDVRYEGQLQLQAVLCLHELNATHQQSTRSDQIVFHCWNFR